MSWTHLPDTAPEPTETHAQKVARFRELLEGRTPSLAESAQKLDDAISP